MLFFCIRQCIKVKRSEEKFPRTKDRNRKSLECRLENFHCILAFVCYDTCVHINLLYTLIIYASTYLPSIYP